VSVTLIPWDAGEPYTVAFSTRQGGVSDGPFDSLNLGLRTHDDSENVDENRRRLCEAIGADATRLAMNRQTHSALVNRAQSGERDRDGDGLWTDEHGVPLLALSADCLPIALAFILFLIQPEHITLLLTDQLGIQMLTGAVVLQVVGILIIRRIVDVEF